MSLIRVGRSRSRGTESTSQRSQLGLENGNYVELGEPRKVRVKTTGDSVWEASRTEDSMTNANQTEHVLPRAPLEGYET